jgi:hypothetical protein
MVDSLLSSKSDTSTIEAFSGNLKALCAHRGILEMTALLNKKEDELA